MLVIGIKDTNEHCYRCITVDNECVIIKKIYSTHYGVIGTTEDGRTVLIKEYKKIKVEE